jgi:hypothetical protein
MSLKLILIFTSAKSFEQIHKNGFDIDQSEFLETLAVTDYKGYFILDEEGIFSDVND